MLFSGKFDPFYSLLWIVRFRTNLTSKTLLLYTLCAFHALARTRAQAPGFKLFRKLGSPIQFTEMEVAGVFASSRVDWNSDINALARVIFPDQNYDLRSESREYFKWFSDLMPFHSSFLTTIQKQHTSRRFHSAKDKKKLLDSYLLKSNVSFSLHFLSNWLTCKKNWLNGLAKLVDFFLLASHLVVVFWARTHIRIELIWTE